VTNNFGKPNQKLRTAMGLGDGHGTPPPPPPPFDLRRWLGTARFGLLPLTASAGNSQCRVAKRIAIAIVATSNELVLRDKTKPRK
jgi:hypothetical protein